MWPVAPRNHWLGKNVPRKEGPDKVTGRALYVDDLQIENMLWGVTIRSTVPRGRITSIELDPDAGIDWSELVFVTAKDVPGTNVVTLLDSDQPCLADGVVNHYDEPIALLAHSDRQLLERARRHVRIEYEPLPSIHTIDDSLNRVEVIWGEDNTFTEYRTEKGDVDSVWDHAAHIVEGTYTTGAQEQMYIEPQGIIAVPTDDGLTLHGSMQCPYYIQKAVAPVFDLPPEKVRIVQSATGGGFGGKEEYPSMIAAHAALLAHAAGQPVKIVYDRTEDVEATTKRHPSKTIHKTAVDEKGRLLAMEIDFVIDGGAYKTLSPVVLSRGAIHAAGPYRCDHVRLRARAVATNTPPHGAFRGFGAPQSIFALERHLDRIAAIVGITPEELRARNFLQQNETTAVGQVIKEKINLKKLLDRAMTESNYLIKRRAFDRHNASSTHAIKRGIGLAAFYHGSGFTGAGEVHLASVVRMEGREDGIVYVQASSTEIGQGTNTIFSQIAADALGVHYRRIHVESPDTANVPNSGPTVASRTCMVVGKLVERCAQQLLAQLKRRGLRGKHNDRDFEEKLSEIAAKHGPVVVEAKYEPPPGVRWDEKKFQGDAYAAYSWAVYVAEVSVDTRTYQVTVDDFVAVQEVGRAVHPVLAAGQIEGGVAQAIGFALYEKVVWKDGHVMNPQMTNYIIPTAVDAHSIRVFFVEEPYEHGPGGGKGIGELPMDGPAPAICSAIEHATGAVVREVPVLPEDLMELIEGGRRV